MSERIPTVEDIMLALEAVGYTDAEASEGVERIKKRGIGIGHEMARETMQASIGEAVRKLQAIAWDEGYEAAAKYHSLDTEHGEPNPYREGEGDE